MYFLISQTLGSALLNILNIDMPAKAARARAGGEGRKEWKRTPGVSQAGQAGTLPWGAQEGVHMVCPIRTDSGVCKCSYSVRYGRDHSLAVTTGSLFCFSELQQPHLYNRHHSHRHLVERIKQTIMHVALYNTWYILDRKY